MKRSAHHSLCAAGTLHRAKPCFILHAPRRASLKKALAFASAFFWLPLLVLQRAITTRELCDNLINSQVHVSPPSHSRRASQAQPASFGSLLVGCFASSAVSLRKKQLSTVFCLLRPRYAQSVEYERFTVLSLLQIQKEKPNKKPPQRVVFCLSS